MHIFRALRFFTRLTLFVLGFNVAKRLTGESQKTCEEN
jgi:hypothetical protein